MLISFECPHCGNDGEATRIQSGDDMNWMASVEEIKEMWQCDSCTQYFITKYTIKEIVKLTEESSK